MSQQLPDISIAQQATQLLRLRLPDTWKLELIEQPDLRVLIGSQQGQGQLLTEVHRRFKPGDMDALMGRLARRLRTAGGTPILLISDYLSPRGQEALIAENISFIDLRGNVRIAMDYPLMFVELNGEESLPAGASPASLRGATAGRLIRFLVDVRPPYGVVEIEAATTMNRGYVSRLLDAASDEGLIDRQKRGPVVEVDWAGLIRRRAREVSLMKTNTAFMFVARATLGTFVEQLRTLPIREQLVMTGPVAAYRLNAVAAAASLALYTNEQSERVREALDLIPVEEGANIALLRPPNSLPFELTEIDDGLRYAAASQVAIDCLSGPARMPAEGEAVIEWMAEDENRWRSPNIADYLQRRGRDPDA